MNNITIKEDIENIIIHTSEGEIDFQAEGYDPLILAATPKMIQFKHPTSDQIYTVPCEYSGGAALIFLED